MEIKTFPGFSDTAGLISCIYIYIYTYYLADLVPIYVYIYDGTWRLRERLMMIRLDVSSEGKKNVLMDLV